MGRLIDADMVYDLFEPFADVIENTEQCSAFLQSLQAVQDAPTVEAPTWIPCSERLPEDSGDYLVRPSDNALDDYSEFEEIMIMPYDADCEAFGWWTSYFDPISLGFVDSEFTDYEVIAWMPLPKPYEEKEHE